MVGSSGYGGDLDDRAKYLDSEHENVRWLGHVSDDLRLFGLWKHAGVYFHGHSVGGTNPTLVQAMTLGRPMVARDTTYNREVLDCGGVFCRPDPSSIADAIAKVMRDPKLRAEAVELNRSRAKEIYNWQSVNEAYLGTINPALHNTNNTQK